MVLLFINSLLAHDYDALKFKLLIAAGILIAPIVACIIDMVAGVLREQRFGLPPESRKFRKTLYKIAIYDGVLLITLLIDFFLSVTTHFPWVSIVVCAGVLAIEAYSVYENLPAVQKKRLKKGINIGATAIKGKAELIEKMQELTSEEKEAENGKD